MMKNNSGCKSFQSCPRLNVKWKLKFYTGGNMKRFLFLAFMLFTLVAFTANAPPCDMGKKIIHECNFDVGQANSTITGIQHVIDVYYDVGLTATIEIAQEINPIYPCQPALTEPAIVDLRSKCIYVDCLTDDISFSTSYTTQHNFAMLQPHYTQKGYSIWE